MTNTNHATTALPQRQVQEDFTPSRRGRPDDAIALWAPEITAILTDTDLAGKVAAYPGVPAHIATKLRNAYPRLRKAVKMVGIDTNRWLDKEGNPTDEMNDAAIANGEHVENPAYNTGRLEIRLPAEVGSLGDGKAVPTADATVEATVNDDGTETPDPTPETPAETPSDDEATPEAKPARTGGRKNR